MPIGFRTSISICLFGIASACSVLISILEGLAVSLAVLLTAGISTTRVGITELQEEKRAGPWICPGLFYPQLRLELALLDSHGPFGVGYASLVDPTGVWAGRFGPAPFRNIFHVSGGWKEGLAELFAPRMGLEESFRFLVGYVPVDGSGLDLGSRWNRLAFRRPRIEVGLPGFSFRVSQLSLFYNRAPD